MYIHTYIHIHAYIYPSIHTYTHTYTHKCIHTYHAYIHIPLRVSFVHLRFVLYVFYLCVSSTRVSLSHRYRIFSTNKVIVILSWVLFWDFVNFFKKNRGENNKKLYRIGVRLCIGGIVTVTGQLPRTLWLGWREGFRRYVGCGMWDVVSCGMSCGMSCDLYRTNLRCMWYANSFEPHCA